jgi:copper resistance protein B
MRPLARFGAVLGIVAATAPAWAQAPHDHGPMAAPSDAAPFGAPLDDQRVFYHLLFDQLEGRFGVENSFRWQGEGWAGTDVHRLWLKTEGELTDGVLSDGIQQLFYSHPISPYFDVQVGGRYDLDSYPGRGWGALGIEGLAPLFFKLAATGYIAGDGHLAARLEASYDLLLSQRLILQPQAEMNFYTKDDPARLIGNGLSGVDAGLRLRYEISRKFAPYFGVAYDGKYGATASYAIANGGQANEVRFVLGVRTWW